MRTQTFKILMIIVLSVLIFIDISKAQDFKERAQFDGSKADLKDLLFYEMQYPEVALEGDIQGTVELGFTVMPDASLAEINVKESVSEDIDNEAIRLLKLLKWKPAVIGGTRIACHETLKIKFNINKYRKNCKERGYDQIVYPYQTIDTCFIIYGTACIDQSPTPVFSNNITLARFITEEMQYPEEAFNRNLSGKVKLSFVVEKSGKVSHIRVASSVGGGCDQEAIRILRLLNWMPGIKNKNAVRTESNLEITFSLENGSDHIYLPNNQNNTL